MLRRAQGFSLVEIMIALAIVAVIVGITLPVYQGYNSRAQMAKVSMHFDEAVRATKHEYVDAQILESMGGVPDLPGSAAAWIGVYNTNNVEAPRGGPAYVSTSGGDAGTGAIGVTYEAATRRTVIVRPAFLDLVSFRAEIDMAGANVTQL